MSAIHDRSTTNSRILNAILGRYASPTLLASPQEEVQTVASTIILAALRALNSIYEWCSLAIIGKDESGFFTKLLRLLHEPRFRILAAECLISVLSRRDHHTVILANIFNSSQIESIISAVGFNAVQSISEENYVFEKKCAEIFINLGSVIFYLWSRNADFALPDYAATIFKVLVDLADHDSVVIREGAVLQLNVLLKIPRMESTQFLQPIISSLVPVLIRKLPKCLETEPGLIALAAIAVAFSLFVPLAFTIVFCCRIGGKADDKKGKRMSKCCFSFARTSWETVLGTCLFVSSIPIILAFITNAQLQSAVQNVERVILTSLSDGNTFVRNIDFQMRRTTESAVDSMVQRVFQDLNGVRTILGRPIQNELALETNFESTLKQLRDLKLDISKLVGDCGILLDSAQNTRFQASNTDTALADLSRQIDNAIGQCPSADRSVCNRIDTTGFRVSISFSTYTLERAVSSLSDFAKGYEILDLDIKMQTEFTNIPSQVHAATSDVRAKIKSILRSYRTSLIDSVREFEDLFDNIQSKLSSATAASNAIFFKVKKYDDIKFFVGLGISVSLLFMWTLLLISLCCGCWKGNSKEAFETSCSTRAGGNCLLISVFFIAILSCPLWLAVSSLLIIGAHGQGLICQTLYEEGFTTLGRIADDSNDFGPAGFFGGGIFNNDSLKVPLPEVLRRCEKEESAYKVFQLGNYVNLENLTNVREITTIEKELESLRIDLSNTITYYPDLESNLENRTSVLQLELAAFRLETQQPLLSTRSSSIVDQLEVAAKEISSQSLSTKLRFLASKARDVINNQLRFLEIRKEDLEDAANRLSMESILISKSANTTFRNLQNIQSFLKNITAPLLHHRLRDYSKRISDYMSQFTVYMHQVLRQDVANCKPLWDIYNQTRIVLCRYVFDPLNGFWFSICCCLLIFLFSSMVAMKLAKYYITRSGNSFHRTNWTVMDGQEDAGSNW